MKKKNLTALSITKVIHGFGIAMFNVIYQPFILDITKSLTLTGLIVSLGSIMQFLPMPLVGKLSDKVGHKNTLFASIPLYIIGLTSLILANSNSFYFLVFGIMIYFLGSTFNNINAQFLVSVNSGGNSKGLMYGIVFTSYFIGSIAGNSFVIIGTELEHQFFFMIFIVMLAIEGLVIFFFIKNNIPVVNVEQKEGTGLIGKESKIWLNFVKNRRMRAILIFFTLDLFIYGISLSIYTGGLNDYYQLRTDQISSIVIWMNITNMVFQIPAGRITDKLGKMKSLLLSESFGLGFFALNIISAFLWANSVISPIVPLLIFAHISFALSIVFFIPSEQIILTDLGKNKKAEMYGIVTFVRGLGYIPTGIIGGILMENVNYLAPFFVSSIGVIFEIWFLLKFFKHE